jgi:hypothetical protein
MIAFFVFILSFINQFTLTLWNPTLHPVSHYARVPVTTDYTVHDPTGQIIATEVCEKEHFIDYIFFVSCLAYSYFASCTKHSRSNEYCTKTNYLQN